MQKQVLIDYYNKYGKSYQIIYDNIDNYKLYYDASIDPTHFIVSKVIDPNIINFVKTYLPGFMIRYYTNNINDQNIPYAISSGIVQIILYDAILNDNVLKTAINIPYVTSKVLYFYKNPREIDPNIINQFLNSRQQVYHVPGKVYFIKQY